MKQFAKRFLIDLLEIFLLFLLVAGWGLVENQLLSVTRISIPDSSLPQAFDGFRVAQVSDLHNTEFGKDNARLLQKLREEKPDIIALTGDLIDCYQPDIPLALSFAEQAMQIAPCYFVTGNHEGRISRYRELEEGLRSLGVIILKGESVLLEREGQSIRLLGVSDPIFGRSVDSQLTDLSGEGYSLLLSHRPELFETYCRHGISLVLTGHAHGGQFRIPFLGGVLVPNQGFFPKYDAGCFTEGQTTMYISRGLGNSIFPFRLGNPPELIILTLTRT
jgi:predicted MPP superfamily phosphohydrolase